MTLLPIDKSQSNFLHALPAHGQTDRLRNGRPPAVCLILLIHMKKLKIKKNCHFKFNFQFCHITQNRNCCIFLVLKLKVFGLAIFSDSWGKKLCRII